MITEVFCFFLTASCILGVSASSCNYCKNGNNGVKTTYITPPCDALNFPKNKDVGNCSRAFPISFSSRDTQSINVPCLVMGSANVTQRILTNVGIFLQLRLVNKNRRPYTLSGGVAYEDTYILYEDQIFWASSVCGLDGSYIDGQSAPIAVLSIYYNQKYGFFEKALKYVDGLIGTLIQVQLRSYPNPAFDRFGSYVLQVKQHGSSTTVPDAIAYPWFVVFNRTNNYYTYPGQYIDQYGAWHNCITYVAYPFSTSSPYIGENQFKETFLKLLNVYGKPLFNVLPTNRRCNRPIACAQGIRTE